MFILRNIYPSPIIRNFKNSFISKGFSLTDAIGIENIRLLRFGSSDWHLDEA